MYSTFRSFRIIVSLLLLFFCCSAEADNQPLSLHYVFIAKSSSGKNSNYYNAAYNYYKSLQSFNKNIVLIRNTSSLNSIVETLNKKQQNSLVSKITIVSHASQWSGLNLPISDDDKNKTSAFLLKKHLTSNNIKTVKSGVFSKDITISIDGCGVGRNSQILDQLSNYFLTEDVIKPNITGSQGYAYFYHSNDDKPSFYKSEIPIYELLFPYSDDFNYKNVANDFKEYFGNSVPWSEALELPYKTLEINNFTFRQRVLTVTSYGFREDIKNFSLINNYIKRHDNLSFQLAQYDAVPSDFNWQLIPTNDPEVTRIVGRSIVVTIFNSSNLVTL